MANSKIQLANGDVLIDLTGDTITPENLAEGITAHNAAGEPITGTRSINSLEASTALADGDFVPFYDTSAALSKKTTWASIKAKLKSYFEGLFAPKTHAAAHAAGGTDTLTVSTEMIAASAVTAEKLADNAVTGGKIADGAVTTKKYAAGSVGTTALANGNVTTQKLASDAVTQIFKYKLPKTGWTQNSDGTYEADVTISEIKAGWKGITYARRGTSSGTREDGFSLSQSLYDYDHAEIDKLLSGYISADNTLHFVASSPVTNEVYMSLEVVKR